MKTAYTKQFRSYMGNFVYLNIAKHNAIVEWKMIKIKVTCCFLPSDFVTFFESSSYVKYIKDAISGQEIF